MSKDIRTLVERRRRAYLARGQSGTARDIRHVAEEVASLGIVQAGDLITAIKTRAVDSTTRARMIWLSTKISPNAVVPTLINIFRTTKDRGLLFQAAMGLGSIKNRAGKQLLIETLRGSSNPGRRGLAASALTLRARRNPDVFDALLDAARGDSNIKVRSQSIEALAQAPKRVVSDLRSFAGDRNPCIRFWTCYAMSQVGGETAIKILLNLVDDPARPAGTELNRTVGAEAQWAIKQIREASGKRKRKS
jgi:HEAT repeat protein